MALRILATASQTADHVVKARATSLRMSRRRKSFCLRTTSSSAAARSAAARSAAVRSAAVCSAAASSAAALSAAA
jgi:hypothetical protein